MTAKLKKKQKTIHQSIGLPCTTDWLGFLSLISNTYLTFTWERNLYLGLFLSIRNSNKMMSSGIK